MPPSVKAAPVLTLPTAVIVPKVPSPEIVSSTYFLVEASKSVVGVARLVISWCVADHPYSKSVHFGSLVETRS